MDHEQYVEMRVILGLLIFGVDLVILAIGLTHPGTAGYVVDGLAGLLFVLLWLVGRMA